MIHTGFLAGHTGVQIFFTLGYKVSDIAGAPQSQRFFAELCCVQAGRVFLIRCQKKRESINRFRVAIEVPRKPVHVVSATSRRRTSGSSTATEPTNLRLSHPRARGRLLNAVINYRHERH